jgi:hypothetical protein
MTKEARLVTKSRRALLLNWLRSFLQSLPITIPAGLAAFGTVAIFFLLINQLRGIYVWPLGLLAAIVAGVLVCLFSRGTKRPGSLKEQVVVDIMVVVLATMWVGANFHYTSQHVYTNRDPATYAVTAAWLTTHNDLHLRGSDTFGNVPQINAKSAGFSSSTYDKYKLYSQGVHLLPVLLGLIGRIVGISLMLHFNVLFGGTALLALYGFARYILKPRWALLAFGLFALNLPLIYFARDTYTEPLAATFAFGALALLWLAHNRQRSVLWFMAGLVMGAGVLTRIDAYLTIAIVAAFAVIALALSVVSNKRKAIWRYIMLLVGMATSGLFGWLDVSQLSSQYYGSEWVRLMPELVLIAAIVLLGVIFVQISWRSGLIGRLDKMTQTWRAPAAAGLVIVIALILASRPLWYTNIGTVTRQSATGEITRRTVKRYSELTVFWLAWYMGAVTVATGFMGMAVAAYRIMKRGGLALLASFMVIGGTMALYLVRPSIAPDQIWAARRFVPIIMPGLAFFAALGLQWLVQQKRVWRLPIDGKTATAIIVTLTLSGTLAICYPFLRMRTYVPQLAQIKEVCAQLPKNAAVLWIGTASLEAVQPTHTICDVPAAGLGQPTVAQLSKAFNNAKAKGYQPVLGVFESQLDLIPSPYKEDMRLVHTIEWNDIEQTFTSLPRNKRTSRRSVLLGLPS